MSPFKGARGQAMKGSGRGNGTMMWLAVAPVEFEHPEDLFKLLPLEISKVGCSEAELKSIR